MTTYRDGLPPIPWHLRNRPVERGMSVPFFCEYIDGHWDFRIADGRIMRRCVNERLCWICGYPLIEKLAFAIGPMCAVNRTNAEPPSHRACAEFAILACPFLNQTEKRRRSGGIPAEALEPVGLPIMRQPGVSCLWVTKAYRMFNAPGGVLFKIGDPIEVAWYREGRPATRAEILESIDSGYPILLEAAEQDGPKAIKELAAARERAMALAPKE